jgi:RNA polymerase sigma-70 factor (ECF subfamily)
MADARPTGVLNDLERLFSQGTLSGLTDGQLLDRFLAGRDGGQAESAFAALVERHGPMVLRVCRGVLDDPHDAQDAFQATFLVLVRKAGSVRKRNSVASWLFGVASRVSARARADAARRRKHETRGAAMASTVTHDRPPDDPDLARVVHEEVARLPERYRAAVVLCDLEGRTPADAARALGCPPATLKTRLSRGRDRLRARLIRRGLAAPAVLSAVGLLTRDASASSLPHALARETERAECF